MKTLIPILILCVAMFSGCAIPGSVTRAEIDSADFGAYPENYESIIKEYFQNTLIDPDSMKIQFTSKPYKGYCGRTSVVPQGKSFGYGVPVRVNAKNSYGGYTGWKDYVIYLRDGIVYDAGSSYAGLGPEYDTGGSKSSVVSIETLRGQAR